MSDYRAPDKTRGVEIVRISAERKINKRKQNVSIEPNSSSTNIYVEEFR